MKEIGIKLADGSFYPIMEDGSPCNKNLVLTTVKDNQTRVIVDMYRSKTGTMEDAEYIDSLQIDNLVAHPNGSVELSLNIELDSENKLSASMNDPETGGSSSANVTLVSRTLEERLEPTNYEVVSSKSEADVTESGTAFSMPDESFAADDVVIENETDFELPDEITDDELVVENPPVTDDIASDENEIPAETKASSLDSTVSDTENVSSGEEFSSDEATADTAGKSAAAGAVIAGAAAGGLLARAMAKKEAELAGAEKERPAPSEETLVSDDASVFRADETVSGDAAAVPETETESPSDTDFSEDEFVLPAEEMSAGAEAVSDETVENASDDSFSERPDDSAGGFDFDLPDFTDDDTTLENAALIREEEPSAGNEAEETGGLSDFSTDKTDFDDTAATEDEISVPSDADFSENESVPPAEETSAGEETVSGGFDFDLPDFSDSEETVSSDSSGEFSDETNLHGEEKGSDMFAEDDFNFSGFDSDENFGGDDSAPAAESGSYAADRYVKDATPSNGIVFDGLYDKETAEGNSSSTEEDSVEKKTKVPVIICVVCAIICVLATLLVLFVVPSKYNLFSRHSNMQEETVVESERIEESFESLPEEEPLPPPVEAKEEEIVVVMEPEAVETVVPEPPAEPEKKPADIVYKIKWGDTLWDIADAYYKNPWRYHMIASYNHIKDPDYIISGTTIVLPAK